MSDVNAEEGEEMKKVPAAQEGVLPGKLNAKQSNFASHVAGVQEELHKKGTKRKRRVGLGYARPTSESADFGRSRDSIPESNNSKRARDFTAALYDSHANNPLLGAHQVQRRRAKGPAFPLKSFHNTIKRLLIANFSRGARRLLDLCCGRGGDLAKWLDNSLNRGEYPLYVKGVDISTMSIEECQRRYTQYKQQRKYSNSRLVCEFAASDQLGLSDWTEPVAFQAVSCMFAIHYFFAMEGFLRQFLSNVSRNLQVGGYFFGTVCEGKKVMETLANKPTFSSDMLKLTKQWEGQPKCFGSAYTCSIRDTVTQGTFEDNGSLEYLAFSNVLQGVAKQFGLKPVTNYFFDGIIEQDRGSFLKHFHPNFPESDPSLELASALNAAFVFQKTAPWPVAAAAPPVVSTPAAAPAAGDPAGTIQSVADRRQKDDRD